MCSSQRSLIFSLALEESMSGKHRRIDRERAGEWILTEPLGCEILLALTRPLAREMKLKFWGRR